MWFLEVSLASMIPLERLWRGYKEAYLTNMVRQPPGSRPTDYFQEIDLGALTIPSVPARVAEWQTRWT